MKIKIYQYVNGKFVWWWTKYSQSKKPEFGYIPKSHVTSSFDFGIDATIENYFKGKVSLMAMIQNQLK
jgi:hypothetical protein